MNLESLVQLYADRVGSPTIVFDKDFKVVAFSVHDQEVDHARLSMILSQKGSSRARESIKKHRVQHADGPVIIPPMDGKHSRHVASLRHAGHTVGYISFVPANQSPEAPAMDNEELQQTRNKIGLFLAAMQLETQIGADNTQQLVTDLLNSDQTVRLHAGDTLITNGLISSASSYTVIVISSLQKQEPNTAALRLILPRALSAIPAFPALKAVGSLINNEIVIIAPYEINLQRFLKLMDEPAFSALAAGIGSAHVAITDSFRSYKEAKISLSANNYSKLSGRTAIWSELGLDRILLQLPLDTLTMADLPDPVQALCKSSTDTVLASTIEAYLDNGCDAQKTAQMLHIHRSTLYYRLDRVRDITGVDLSDGFTRRELHTGLQVARLLELCK